MRVLFLNRYAGSFGGVEAWMRRAALALRARGATCLLGRQEDCPGAAAWLEAFDGGFLEPRPEGLAAAARALGPDVVLLNKLEGARAFLEPRAAPRVLRYVHDHDLCCPRRHKYYAWTGAPCPRPAGAFCWLDAGFVERRGRLPALRSARAFFAELRANRGLDLLLVGSRAMREELLANGFPAERVRVLPPVAPPPPAAAAPRPADLDPDRALLLYAGQLVRGKGVDLLLRAFASAAARRPGIRLGIAGEGNARAGLGALAARLGLAGRVEFYGGLGEEALESRFAAAYLLAFPSRWPEPFGMVGLEAMRRGLPVAGFDVGGVPDWLEEGVTGLLARPGDPGDLARALERLLDDPGLARRMGEAGRARAALRFDWDEGMDALLGALKGEGQ